MRVALLGVLVLAACAAGSDATAVEPGTTAAIPTAEADVGSTATSSGEPDSAAPGSTAATPTQSVRPDGFPTTKAVATAADGSTCAFCLWLADTPDRRSRGLMFVTDLGGPEAMAFRYPDPHTGTFWMKNTVLPLSIAFFAPDGGFLSSFDMEPCTADPCPTYPTASGFLVAVEVPQGGLAALGLTPGSRLEVLDVPCDD